MINPLNELSSVYMQNISEKKKCDEKLPQGNSVDGGDAAKPGKDKNYVKPMATEEKKTHKEHYSWRDEIREVAYGSYGYNVADRTDSVPTKPMDSTDSRKKVKERKIKNKVRINPPQGVTEGFAELGGVVAEMYEISEKIDIKKADMGDVIKDFRKSDAPQCKGKSDKKKQEMAVAAKLATEETEEEKKKREMLAKTKEHDDKQSGKMAEAYYGGEEQRKKDEKKAAYEKQLKKMLPKRGFDQMGREIDPRSGKVLAGESALAGILSTIRAKNGMGTITAKGADKLQAKKEKTMGEEMSVKDQMRISREASKNRNPNPDYRKINTMKASNQKKDNRTDAQKMTDATGPRKGSNYRGD